MAVTLSGYADLFIEGGSPGANVYLPVYLEKPAIIDDSSYMPVYIENPYYPVIDNFCDVFISGTGVPTDNYRWLDLFIRGAVGSQASYMPLYTLAYETSTWLPVYVRANRRLTSFAQVLSHYDINAYIPLYLTTEIITRVSSYVPMSIAGIGEALGITNPFIISNRGFLVSIDLNDPDVLQIGNSLSIANRGFLIQGGGGDQQFTRYGNRHLNMSVLGSVTETSVLNMSISGIYAINSYLNMYIRESSWDAPLGIPAPEWNTEGISYNPITVSHRMYSEDTYDFGDGPEPYPDAGDGPYTHYVDNTHGSATDTLNDYGTPTKPRLTIPRYLEPGDIVEVHGGPYDYQKGGVNCPIFGVGTAEKPIFVRGIGSPQLKGSSKTFDGVGGHGDDEHKYIIIEDIVFQAFTIEGNASYICVRNCEITASFVGLYEHGFLRVLPNLWPTRLAHHIVFYNNTVHDNGNWQGTVDNNDGMAISYNCSYIWIVDNTMYHNDGNGLIINALYDYRQSSTHHIYVGRNLAYENRQAGLWCKQADDVIFSQNVSRDHRRDIEGFSDGEGIGCQYGPNRIWIIFNYVYNCDGGIVQQSISGAGSGGPMYIIGNLIYHIHDMTGGFIPEGTYNSYGIRINAGVDVHAVANTIYDCDGGIKYLTDGMINLENNIIDEVHVSGRHVQVDTTPASVSFSMHNCLLYQSGLPIKIKWVGATYTSISEFQDDTGKGEDCINANPQFTDGANDDYSILQSSPCKDSGILSETYATFSSLYGIDIRKDIGNITRPVGSYWDIGAYEYPIPPDTISGMLNTYVAVNSITDSYLNTFVQGNEIVSNYLNISTASYDMLLWAKMDDDSTDGVDDSSGKNNTGICTGNMIPTYLSDSGYNQSGAYSFNGTSNYIDFGDVATTSIQNSFTVSAWVLTSGLGAGDMILVDKWNELGSNHTQKSFSVSITPQGAIKAIVLQLSPSLKYSVHRSNNGVILTESEWQHMAAIWDGSTNWRFYANGIDAGNVTITDYSIPTIMQNVTEPLKIGCGKGNAGVYAFFSGLSDDVRIYSTGLPSTDILSIYNEGQ